MESRTEGKEQPENMKAPTHRGVGGFKVFHLHPKRNKKAHGFFK